jgi:hypothetical protein
VYHSCSGRSRLYGKQHRCQASDGVYKSCFAISASDKLITPLSFHAVPEHMTSASGDRGSACPGHYWPLYVEHYCMLVSLPLCHHYPIVSCDSPRSVCRSCNRSSLVQLASGNVYIRPNAQPGLKSLRTQLFQIDSNLSLVVMTSYIPTCLSVSWP